MNGSLTTYTHNCQGAVSKGRTSSGGSHFYLHEVRKCAQYRFTAKELDPETNLYYYGARYYDAVVSRWVSADDRFDDPLKSTGLDIYAFCLGNPVVYLDPDGHKVMTFARKTEIAAGIGVQWTNGYAVQYGEGIEFKVYQLSSRSLTAGLRLDTGADLNFYGSDTVDEWINENYVVGSIDVGIAGVGFGYSTTKNHAALNASGGFGGGGSFSLPDTTKYFNLDKNGKLPLANKEKTEQFRDIMTVLFGKNQVTPRNNNQSNSSNKKTGNSENSAKISTVRNKNNYLNVRNFKNNNERMSCHGNPLPKR